MTSEKLKKIKKELDLTTESMSKKLGMPERTLASYERNERMPKIDFATLLCRTFGINLNWFCADIGDMFIKEEPAKSGLTEKQLEELFNKFMDEREAKAAKK